MDSTRSATVHEDAAQAWLPVPRAVFWSVTAGFALLLLALSLLHLHGFSLPCWHDLIDQSPAPEVLLGSARRVRSDDWAVGLPAIFSESAQEPTFPITNRLIGDGKVNALVGPSVPVKHWVSLFRPQLWGYFVGRNIGMAWHWWVRVLGVLYAWWLVLSLVSGGRIWLSMLGAVSLLFSPFFQYWALNSEPMTAAMGLGFVAAAGIAFSSSARAIVLHGLLLVWAGGCFALSVVYPPYQVCLAYLFAFLCCGYFLRERGRLVRCGLRTMRVCVLTGSVVLIAALLTLYAWETIEAIRIMAATVYPGRRTVTGGDLTVFRAFNNVFTFALWHQRLTPAGNICEGASFYLFFPLVLSAALAARALRRQKLDPVIVALGLYLAGLSVYATVGAPDFLTRVTLLGRVEGIRTILGIGLADTLLWIAFVSRAGTNAVHGGSRIGLGIGAGTRRGFRAKTGSGAKGRTGTGTASGTETGTGAVNRNERQVGSSPDLPVGAAGTGEVVPPAPSKASDQTLAFALAGAWGGGLFLLGLVSRSRLVDTSAAKIAFAALVFAAIGYTILRRWRHAAALLATVGFISTGWFNPVVRGGSEYLENNVLARTILNLDRAAGGGTRWVVYNSLPLANLFRAIGIRAINGVHPYPQFQLWSRLDPDGSSSYVYNRYAHVGFQLAESKDDLRIITTQRDIVVVYLDPGNPAFAKLGVDFLLYSGQGGESLDARPNLRKVAVVGEHSIYRVQAASSTGS